MAKKKIADAVAAKEALEKQKTLLEKAVKEKLEREAEIAK